MWRTDSKRPWCWERLKAGGEGDDRGWEDWMAPLTQWTWVWAGSRSWWWQGSWRAAVHGVTKSQTWLRDWTAAAAAKSLQSCPTLCDPIDSSPPGSPIPGILQARTLEWATISFSNAWKWKVKVKSLSHVWLLVTPWTAAYQAPPSMGFSRWEYWSGVPLSPPSDWTELNWLQDVMGSGGRVLRKPPKGYPQQVTLYDRNSSTLSAFFSVASARGSRSPKLAGVTRQSHQAQWEVGNRVMIESVREYPVICVTESHQVHFVGSMSAEVLTPFFSARLSFSLFTRNAPGKFLINFYPSYPI